MVKLYLSDDIHNISNSIYNAKMSKTFIVVGIQKINYQGWIWTVATKVMDTLFVLEYLFTNIRSLILEVW